MPVALPHGTEVLTRTERTGAERRLAPGVVGRVVRARDGGYDVHFVGVSERWYAHHELARRFANQVPGPFGQQAPQPPSWGTD